MERELHFLRDNIIRFIKKQNNNCKIINLNIKFFYWIESDATIQFKILQANFGVKISIYMRYKNVIQKEKRKRRDIKMEEKLNNNAKTEKPKRKYRPRNNKVNKTNNEGEKTKRTTKKSKNGN